MPYKTWGVHNVVVCATQPGGREVNDIEGENVDVVIDAGEYETLAITVADQQFEVSCKGRVVCLLDVVEDSTQLTRLTLIYGEKYLESLLTCAPVYRFQFSFDIGAIVAHMYVANFHFTIRGDSRLHVKHLRNAADKEQD